MAPELRGLNMNVTEQLKLYVADVTLKLAAMRDLARDKPGAWAALKAGIDLMTAQLAMAKHALEEEDTLLQIKALAEFRETHGELAVLS